MKWEALNKNEAVHQSKHQQLQQFYKLHYAAKNIQTKTRAKSQLTIAASKLQIQTTPRNEYKKIKKAIQQSQSKPKYTFEQLLSPAMVNKITQSMLTSLPVKNVKQLEQYSTNHSNVKAVLQRSKKQKIKMNKLILSHKQSDEIKMQYLQNKRNLISKELNSKVKAIYSQFFQKDYEHVYATQSNAEQSFNQHIHTLMQLLSHKIYQY